MRVFCDLETNGVDIAHDRTALSALVWGPGVVMRGRCCKAMGVCILCAGLSSSPPSNLRWTISSTAVRVDPAILRERGNGVEEVHGISEDKLQRGHRSWRRGHSSSSGLTAYQRRRGAPTTSPGATARSDSHGAQWRSFRIPALVIRSIAAPATMHAFRGVGVHGHAGCVAGTCAS